MSLDDKLLPYRQRSRSAKPSFVVPVVVAALAALTFLGWTFTIAHLDRIRALFGDGSVVWRLLLAIAVIVTAGWAAGLAAERLGQPRVIGEILVGILLGPTFFGQIAPGLQEGIFTSALMPYLNGIASVGVATFMLIIGAEVSFSQLRAGRRTTVPCRRGSCAIEA